MYPYQNNSQSYGPGYGSDPNQPAGYGYPPFGGNNPDTTYPPMSGPSYPGSQPSMADYAPPFSGAYGGTPVYQQNTPYQPPSNQPYMQYGSGGPPMQQPPYNSGPIPQGFPPQPATQYGGLPGTSHEPPYGGYSGSNPPFPMNNNPSPFQNPQGYNTQPHSMPSGVYPNLPNQNSYPPASNMNINMGMQHIQPQPSIMLASLEQYQGTIQPFPMFNADTDCRALRQAMKGMGTNENVIIQIIANRSNVQRQQIKLEWKTQFGSDLVKDLEKELSGTFRETIMALFNTPHYYEAWSCHEALQASKEGALREILLTRSNAEIRAIVDEYKRIYQKDLEHDINNRLSGDFKRILISAVQANREELSPPQIQQARQYGIESVINRDQARQDAEELYRAGAGKIGTDEKTFNAIFSRRSYYQLRAIFEEYQKKHHKDIMKVVDSEFSGHIKEAYKTLILCIRDRPCFFADRIHRAVTGLGTKDSTLIRVIVTRSEIDLVQIKERYHQMFKRSLAHAVASDTSGDYKRILLAIIK